MSTTATATSSASRRQKWHPKPPPPPSPKILNLPRRIRQRKPSKKPTKNSTYSTSNTMQKYHSLFDLQLQQGYYYCNGDHRKGNLERLFGEEREFSRKASSVPVVLLNSSSSALSLSSGEKREKVGNEVKEEEDDGESCGGGRGGFVEEKWKFQAEMLRAECNFLRKERELALKKLEKNKVQMQRTLRSAVETLISGREKIFEGKNVSAVLEEEIEDLAEKLEELQRNSGIKDYEVKKCSNFDKHVCHLQRRLEKLGGISDEKRANELQELLESSLNNMSSNLETDKQSSVSGPRNQNKSTDMEVLRSKMEGLSKETWDRHEEDFGSMLSNTANSSVASSASTSKRIECPLESTFSSARLYQEALQQEDGKCSGRCKAIVRKIVEQVRVETEQWTQMQVMLGTVREEMEELEASRNFWEDQALNSDSEIKRLQSSVQEWKEKALNFEIKADELQKELAALRGDLEKLRKEECNEHSREITNSQNTSLLPLSNRHGKENHRAFYQLNENHQTADAHNECKEMMPTVKKNLTPELDTEIILTTDVKPISLGKQLEKEKRLLLHRLKEKHQTKANAKSSSRKQESDCRKKCNGNNVPVTVKRSPFRDIGNSSPLMKQSSRTIFPLHS